MPVNVNNKYIPTNWYWTADDGRIFSSVQQALVPDTDPGYKQFLAANNRPTPWPRDDTGAQTDASLHGVVVQYDIFVNNMYYAANQRWLSESSGMTVSGIASAPNGMPLLTDDRSKNLVGLAAAAAQADSAFTTVWVAADWNNYAMTNAEIISMAEQMEQHIHDCFIAYDNAVNGIKRGEIKERKQIDEMFAPLRGRFRR